MKIAVATLGVCLVRACEPCFTVFLCVSRSNPCFALSPFRAAACGPDPRFRHSAAKQLLSKEFTLDGAKIWTDTGINLQAGQRIIFTADGHLRYSDAKADNGPDGLARAFKDLIRILPYNDAGRGALIAESVMPMSRNPS